MSLFDALISAAGGAVAGAVDGEQAVSAAKAGTTVSMPMSIIGGIAAGAAGLYGSKMLGKNIAEKAVAAGVGMLSAGLGIQTYQSVLKTNGATQPNGTTGITATSPTTPPGSGVTGYRRGVVGALPPARGRISGRELATSYAMLR
jgi:hypothetical protein